MDILISARAKGAVIDVDYECERGKLPGIHPGGKACAGEVPGSPVCPPPFTTWREESNMRNTLKKRLRPVLFTAGGALAGLAYYYFVGCSSGACPVTSHPLVTMAYVGLAGWLLSGISGKECGGKCNM